MGTPLGRTDRHTTDGHHSNLKYILNQPKDISKHFQMLSEMSFNDLGTIGYTQGFGENVDNHRSAVFNNAAAATASCSGNGFTNNRIFAENGATTGAPVTNVAFSIPAHRYQTTCQVKQNTGTINDAVTSKLSRYVDLTATNSYKNFVKLFGY